MWTSTLAKHLGFKSARSKGFWSGLNYLNREGIIKVVQSGYRADSMHHSKLVEIINLKLLVYFGGIGHYGDLHLQSLSI